MNTIDLNVDMGESFGNWSLGDDEGLLEIATSANIACGFHAGYRPPPPDRLAGQHARCRDRRPSRLSGCARFRTTSDGPQPG